jgi:hypothetical protein
MGLVSHARRLGSFARVRFVPVTPRLEAWMRAIPVALIGAILIALPGAPPEWPGLAADGHADDRPRPRLPDNRRYRHGALRALPGHGWPSRGSRMRRGSAPQAGTGPMSAHISAATPICWRSRAIEGYRLAAPHPGLPPQFAGPAAALYASLSRACPGCHAGAAHGRGPAARHRPGIAAVDRPWLRRRRHDAPQWRGAGDVRRRGRALRRHLCPLLPGVLAGGARGGGSAAGHLQPRHHPLARLLRDRPHRRYPDPAHGGYLRAAGAGGLGPLAMAAECAAADRRTRHAGPDKREAGGAGSAGGAPGHRPARAVRAEGKAALPRGAGPDRGSRRVGGGDDQRAPHRAGLHP